jgi:predicted HTH domain antitoxin
MMVLAKLRTEIALALYRRGVLSYGKARRLAKIDRWDFEELLGERKIPRHYTEADLQDDIRYAREGVLSAPPPGHKCPGYVEEAP